MSGPAAFVEIAGADPAHYVVNEAGMGIVPACVCQDCLRRVESSALVRRLAMYERSAEALRSELRRRS